MKARIVVLGIIATGLAIYHLTVAPKSRVRRVPPARQVFDEDLKEVEKRQRVIRDWPAPGKEPRQPVELSIRVWTDPADGKNRLYYEITEAHGYYVDTFDLEFWYKPNDEVTRPEDSSLVIPVHVNNYLKANGVLRGHLEVVWAELWQVGGDLGSTQNWDARVVHYHRARLETPPGLPDPRAMVD